MSYYNLDQHLTTNFKLKEFVIHQQKEFLTLSVQDQGKMIIYFTDIAEKLEVFRSYVDNQAVFISSGWRSVAHNTQVGGRSKSLHLFGLAVDIYYTKLSLIHMRKLIDLFGSCIYYKSDGFYHVDLRNKYFAWSNWVDIVN